MSPFSPRIEERPLLYAERRTLCRCSVRSQYLCFREILLWSLTKTETTFWKRVVAIQRLRSFTVYSKCPVVSYLFCNAECALSIYFSLSRNRSPNNAFSCLNIDFFQAITSLLPLAIQYRCSGPEIINIKLAWSLIVFFLEIYFVIKIKYLLRMF